MSSNDGGPAFPVLVNPRSDGTPTGAQTGSATYWEMGMSLRDYFAAKAMPDLMARSIVTTRRPLFFFRLGLRRFWPSVFPPVHMTHEHNAPELAKQAYVYADAMLLARTKAPAEA